MSKDKTRVYRFKDAKEPTKDRLIRAVSQAGSTSFAVRGRFSSSIASQADMEELLGSGVKVEDGTQEPAA